MDDKELDAIADLAHRGLSNEIDALNLIAALREAWATINEQEGVIQSEYARLDEMHRDEVERIHREKRELTTIVVRQRDTIDRVRAEIEPYLGGGEGWSPNVDLARRIEAAIEGES